MSSLKPEPTIYPEDIECIVDPVNGKGGIYISNVQAAQNLITLKKHGIKAVLTAAISIDLSHDKCNVPLYKKVPGEDHQKFDLSKYFGESVSFIQNSLKITNVLVHCMAGVSRSVSLVLAYLIKAKGMTYDQSYSLVKCRRKIIYPNDGFIKQLKDYDKQCNRDKQRVTVNQPVSKSPINISEKFKSILSKYDSPSKITKTTTLGDYNYSTLKYNTSDISPFSKSPSKVLPVSDISRSPMRKTTLEYSPVRHQYDYSSPRKTYEADYKDSFQKTREYQNQEDLQKRIQSIRKKYSSKMNDFQSYSRHERTKSYIENDGPRLARKTSDVPEMRNSPTRLFKKISNYDHY